MPRKHVKPFSRLWRGMGALVIVALAPKCAVCVAGYLGLGALLGLAGPEICGATRETGSAHPATLVIVTGCLCAGAAGRVLKNRSSRALRHRLSEYHKPAKPLAWKMQQGGPGIDACPVRHHERN